MLPHMYTTEVRLGTHHGVENGPVHRGGNMAEETQVTGRVAGLDPEAGMVTSGAGQKAGVDETNGGRADDEITGKRCTKGTATLLLNIGNL